MVHEGPFVPKELAREEPKGASYGEKKGDLQMCMNICCHISTWICVNSTR